MLFSALLVFRLLRQLKIEGFLFSKIYVWFEMKYKIMCQKLTKENFSTHLSLFLFIFFVVPAVNIR